MKKILIILLFITKYCFGQYPYTINGYPLVNNGGVFVPEFKPTDIAGCQLWLDAGQGITKDGSNYVSTWADQSGNGNNATQGTGANQPLWVDNQLNGKPVIRLDGSNDRLIGANELFNTDNNFTFFIIVKSHRNYNYNWIFQSTTINAYSKGFSLIAGFDNKFLYYNFGGFYVYQTTQTINTSNYYNVMICKKTITFPPYIGEIKTYFNVNGLYAGITNMNSGYIADDMYHIGGWQSATNNPANCDIAEIIAYDNGLSDSDILKVENYLNTKYAIY